MKKFYHILITLLTVTQSNIAAAGSSGHVQERVLETSGTGLQTLVDARSVAESQRSCGTTILTQHERYRYDSTTGRGDVAQEYCKLMGAYTDLLEIISRTDTRTNALLEKLRRELPSCDDDASADDERVNSLPTAIEQLIELTRTLRKSTDDKTAEITALQSRVAELSATNAAKDAEVEREARWRQQVQQQVDKHQADWVRHHKTVTQAKDAEIAKLRAQLAEANQRAGAQAVPPAGSAAVYPFDQRVRGGSFSSETSPRTSRPLVYASPGNVEPSPSAQRGSMGGASAGVSSRGSPASVNEILGRVRVLREMQLEASTVQPAAFSSDQRVRVGSLSSGTPERTPGSATISPSDPRVRGGAATARRHHSPTGCGGCGVSFFGLKG
jgi:hypothetical protein